MSIYMCAYKRSEVDGRSLKYFSLKKQFVIFKAIVIFKVKVWPDATFSSVQTPCAFHETGQSYAFLFHLR